MFVGVEKMELVFYDFLCFLGFMNYFVFVLIEREYDKRVNFSFL